MFLPLIAVSSLGTLCVLQFVFVLKFIDTGIFFPSTGSILTINVRKNNVNVDSKRHTYTMINSTQLHSALTLLNTYKLCLKLFIPKKYITTNLISQFFFLKPKDSLLNVAVPVGILGIAYITHGLLDLSLYEIHSFMKKSLFINLK